MPYHLRIPIVEESKGQRRVEKWLLRKSFDILNSDGDPYLPDDILWRRKEAFSDGVSSCAKSWYEIIQEHVEDKYTAIDFKNENMSYHIIPPTKEALYFRELFNNTFDYNVAHVIPYYWMPKWSGNMKDPSARQLSVYDE